jgi:hypothetical protein
MKPFRAFLKGVPLFAIVGALSLPVTASAAGFYCWKAIDGSGSCQGSLRGAKSQNFYAQFTTPALNATGYFAPNLNYWSFWSYIPNVGSFSCSGGAVTVCTGGLTCGLQNWTNSLRWMPGADDNFYLSWNASAQCTGLTFYPASWDLP